MSLYGKLDTQKNNKSGEALKCAIFKIPRRNIKAYPSQENVAFRYCDL